MKVDLRGVLSTENEIVELQVECGLAHFESKLGMFPVTEKKPFRLHLENQENRRLLIRSETEMTFAASCDRCLEEVPVKLRLAIDRIFSLEEADSEEDGPEKEGFIEGDSLDVDGLLYQEILTCWPMKILCREDCKGICKRCGANLNRGACSCERGDPDLRMAAIKDIFAQFQEESI